MTFYVIQHHDGRGWDAYARQWVDLACATGFEFHAIAACVAARECGDDIFGWSIVPRSAVGSIWIGVAA